MTESLDAANPWRQEAEVEQARILAALGEITEGGLVCAIEHIGATSVAGLPARPCIDLALAINPFPLDPTLLAALGYQLTIPQPESPGEVTATAEGGSHPEEQRAQHSTGRFQLFISEPGSAEWTNHLLVRDYLLHEADGRARYIAAKGAGEMARETEQESSLKDALFADLLAEANRWWPGHYGFRPIEFVAQELAGFEHPWYFSSGWAIDLHLGRVTRVHEDVDVVLARADQLALREQLSQRGWRFVTPLHGKLEVWPPHMRVEMPRHQVHAHRDGQFIDFLLTDLTSELWPYRRNPLIIRHAAQAFLQSSDGYPYLAPELVLLFKSKNTGRRERSKDQRDYEAVVSHLGAEARAWLRWALIASDPGHPWIEELG